MKIKELQTMAYAIQPNSAAARGLDGRERLLAHVELVQRFRELITSGLNSLVFRQAVAPELMNELQRVEEALPGVRSRALSAAPRRRPGSGD